MLFIDIASVAVSKKIANMNQSPVTVTVSLLVLLAICNLSAGIKGTFKKLYDKL